METPPNVAVAISSTHISNLVSFLVFFFLRCFKHCFFLCVSWHVFEFRVAFVRISVRVKNSFVRLFIFFFLLVDVQFVCREHIKPNCGETE